MTAVWAGAGSPVSISPVNRAPGLARRVMVRFFMELGERVFLAHPVPKKLAAKVTGKWGKISVWGRDQDR